MTTDTAHPDGPTPELDLDAIIERRGRAGASDGYGPETGCQCQDAPHENALHDLAAEDIPALVAEVRRLREPRLVADEQLRKQAERIAELEEQLAGTQAAYRDDFAAQEQKIGELIDERDRETELRRQAERRVGELKAALDEKPHRDEWDDLKAERDRLAETVRLGVAGLLLASVRLRALNDGGGSR